MSGEDAIDVGGTVNLAYYHRDGIVAMRGSATLSICQSRAMSSSAPDTRNASTEMGRCTGLALPSASGTV